MSDDRTAKPGAWRSEDETDPRARKLRELESLRERVARLEGELAEAPATDWRTGRYTAYYATTGFMLGMFGAAVSLLSNVVGSLIWSQVRGEPQSPLRLIQVYLTFPLGEAALSMDNGLVLAIGCCLYIATGMMYGVLFNLALSRLPEGASFGKRIALVSLLSLAVWLVNFYLLLSWLQPLFFGGNWIVRLVPWWVAALTHLVFGWTMVLVYPWGQFIPYRLKTESR